jgi:hypothetical protein
MMDEASDMLLQDQDDNNDLISAFIINFFILDKSNNKDPISVFTQR